MKKGLLLVALLSLFAGVAWASTVAIVDSGTDIFHPAITYKIWENKGESRFDNAIDDDKNGYIDDVYGWNFGDDNNQLIDMNLAQLLNADVSRFFEIQAKSYDGTMTSDDLVWVRKMLEDQLFLARVERYAGFMHGTHVAGIVGSGNDNVELMIIKLLSTEASILKPSGMIVKSGNDADLSVIKAELKTLAQMQMRRLDLVSSYVGQKEADVANGSFGISFISIAESLAPAFGEFYGRAPTEAELYEITLYFFQEVLLNGKMVVQKAPNTLFVFAAGNDGTDNDTMPTSPANISNDNVISVAATFNNIALANFSNYGIKTVDVAAPGVNIVSSAPNNEYMRISGTSQAAPYVANIASRVKDANPRLSAGEMKLILCNTVDAKSFLAARVRCGGVVNGARAIRAAQLSRSLSLVDAINSAKTEVANMPTMKINKGGMVRQGAPELILPLPSYMTLK
ncbi:MAG: hypothetical protein A2504_11060 [Bdellovibrionales bacterium RIFOXYD12_FULL_39_22]|nr:MAG: hypothetical protein A2385_09625 [Bdellovibrionales bacterium RIFOXYB1_FULL_39_21]OFZ44215.1 MAG: hypothetical protein A2485_07245 [Bdellovibrionales bacterium RIFOXYC12_FULL_39_17]OFZ46757.1 MAG: hypothetical protein A2404_04480 [Bdellovibrionales bacterium RIFOXYC1_FULL_39_130]OFZ75966.1 MAG: hypothetical protein A2560_02670 [Bdellovibrionales bacterium RIFOXYD1_FULL_39_84]OFZ95436.1 MAG: hypothetical protein A2504_11060 [Bdellovibrionales bacterium RIFOXYD12_FULL_39_22]HLE09831.1 S8